MPEDNLVSESLPDRPALTPTENELPPTGIVAPETPLGEKIFAAAGGVFDKFAVPFKRGRGRPRKDGSPKASDVPLADVPPGVPPAAPVVAPVANPAHNELFRRSVASAVRGVLDFAKRLVRSKAKQAGIDSSFTEKALSECDVEPQVMADFNDSLAIVLEKYNARTDYAPEIALAISTARLGTPYVLLLKSFNEEIARKRAAEKGGAK